MILNRLYLDYIYCIKHILYAHSDQRPKAQNKNVKSLPVNIVSTFTNVSINFILI